MKSRYLEVGQIVGTFGIKGELKFHSESDFIEDRLSKGNVLYLKQNDTYEPITIDSARLHKNNYMITINGHNNINDVLKYVGFSLYVDTTKAKELEDGVYYCDDLIGLKVYNQNDEYLGTVTDVIDVPSAAILEVINEDKKVLIPFVNEFIILIDDEKIVINEIEGLRW